MQSSSEPPFYVLVSHSSLSNISPSTAQSASLAHPTIQYHYADDSPLTLLPQSPSEHVLVLDYDPGATNAPVVNSLSRGLVVSGLKVAEAPGAAAVADDEPGRNDRMYILETTLAREDKLGVDASREHQTPEATLARFKQRNTILRRVLQYPDTAKTDQSPNTATRPAAQPVSPSQPVHPPS
ncbi:hypothetical protein PLICRDRAFT_35743 [Plicaturopsis crispa FD-325 SS-3]|nr:hypothetical protein PLICRDRAFT_35743 [Plicaturopsis crispa FD-325 SS-3]